MPVGVPVDTNVKIMAGDPSIAGLVLDSPFSDLKATAAMKRDYWCFSILPKMR